VNYHGRNDHDAHVKEREAIIQKVVDRMCEWHSVRKLASETWAEHGERMRRLAGQKLAAYKWNGREYVKRERYTTTWGYDGWRDVGFYKQLPARVIHSIMCVNVERSK